MLRRPLALAPFALLVALWAGSYRWSAWVWAAWGPVAFVDKGAIYVVSGFSGRWDADIVTGMPEVWEEEFGATRNRWLPWRRVPAPGGRWLHVVPLWVPAVPLACLAWWGWRRTRVRGRGFEVRV
ncbi:MAG TPA: hypothetical protein VEA69_17855 [Tepidisphaeraceae bacterium]|nr:hypothetical protein [Tepidisphaeraceae bacterium]